MKYNLFPVSVVRYICKSISSKDRKSMMNSVDLQIEKGHYQKGYLTPKYQTEYTLFQDNCPSYWQKLKKSFYDACHYYIKETGFAGSSYGGKGYTLTDSEAWAFQSYKSLNDSQEEIRNNFGIYSPWHDHSPAYLAGVYYLKDPGDGSTGGTDFHNPVITRRDVVEVPPVENSWIIFPGWLQHRSVTLDVEDTRYVVAANMYSIMQNQSPYNDWEDEIPQSPSMKNLMFPQL